MAVGLAFLFGVGQQFWSLLVTGLTYRELPEELVGRGMGGVAFVSSLLAPLGPLLGGALAGVALPSPSSWPGGSSSPSPPGREGGGGEGQADPRRQKRLRGAGMGAVVKSEGNGKV